MSAREPWWARWATTPVVPVVVLALVGVPFAVGLAAADAPPEPEVVCTFADPDIVESSGLVARNGLLTTVNDSGDTGRVFTVDPADGATVGVTTWSEDPTDVEALAPADEGEVWVGDIGDNPTERDSVEVARVPVGPVSGGGEREVDAPTYELVYPDGPRDAETLLAHPRSGRLVVVTKGVFGGEVLLAPADLDPDAPNRMRRVGTAVGVATGGAFLPDGRHLVVRTYSEATVYTWPDLRTVGSFDLPEQPQGEALAVAEDGTVYLTSEGVDSQVLRVELPRRIERELAH